MARWQPDACGRLQKAALELYDERGYDSTTVAEIAERAGLTKRTFFRYFADKREVLFYGADELKQLFVDGVAAAPPDACPLEAVAAALSGAGALFDDRRPYAARRQSIIAANPELQERELIKLASLADAVAAALRARGVAEPAATLAAQSGLTVFRVAFDRWVSEPEPRPLGHIVGESLEQLRAVAAA